MEEKNKMIYGTAWKEDKTEDLVYQALQTGFRAIDTANQRKHYVEAAVGEGIAKAMDAALVKRSDLFLQTKFTFIEGQDSRLPYDPKAPVSVQVLQSFESSLEHLRTDKIDAYLLHGPSTLWALTERDWEAWNAMELLHSQERVRFIGISNVQPQQLQSLIQHADVKPHFVQNRCFASQLWDKRVREICLANGIQYQGFSLLTANMAVLQTKRVRELAQDYNCTLPQLVFAFSRQIGILPLTGTTQMKHMTEDLVSLQIQLPPKVLKQLEQVTFSSQHG